jgi:predicted nucleotidyltransferase
MNISFYVKEESLEDLLIEGLNTPALVQFLESMKALDELHKSQVDIEARDKVLTEVEFRKGRYKPRESDQFVSKFKFE